MNQNRKLTLLGLHGSTMSSRNVYLRLKKMIKSRDNTLRKTRCATVEAHKSSLCWGFTVVQRVFRNAFLRLFVFRLSRKNTCRNTYGIAVKPYSILHKFRRYCCSPFAYFTFSPSKDTLIRNRYFLLSSPVDVKTSGPCAQVVLHALAHVPPLRNFFVEPESYKDCKSDLVSSTFSN